MCLRAFECCVQSRGLGVFSNYILPYSLRQVSKLNPWLTACPRGSLCPLPFPLNIGSWDPTSSPYDGKGSTVFWFWFVFGFGFCLMCVVAKDNTGLSCVYLWAFPIPEGYEFPLVLWLIQKVESSKVYASQGPSRKRCREIMGTNCTLYPPSFTPFLFELWVTGSADWLA